MSAELTTEQLSAKANQVEAKVREAHFKKIDDGRCGWAERGVVYKAHGHEYALLSHHDCGFHMHRLAPCNGECYVGEAGTPNPLCEEFACISERAIGRTWYDAGRRVKVADGKIAEEVPKVEERKAVTFTAGEKVTYKGRTYDFGYIGGTGKAILYEEGETNMQDSFAIDLNLVEKKL